MSIQWLFNVLTLQCVFTPWCAGKWQIYCIGCMVCISIEKNAVFFQFYVTALTLFRYCDCNFSFFLQFHQKCNIFKAQFFLLEIKVEFALLSLKLWHTTALLQKPLHLHKSYRKKNADIFCYSSRTFIEGSTKDSYNQSSWKTMAYVDARFGAILRQKWPQRKHNGPMGLFDPSAIKLKYWVTFQCNACFRAMLLLQRGPGAST